MLCFFNAIKLLAFVVIVTIIVFGLSLKQHWFRPPSRPRTFGLGPNLELGLVLGLEGLTSFGITAYLTSIAAT